MTASFGFRMRVAVAGTAIAETFGAVGLWQRSHILSRPFFMDQTLWDSTARFHVWPWPFKAAAIWAFPAFLGGSILTMLHLLIRTLPETAELLPAGAVALLLWYWVATRLEKHPTAIRWTSLAAFLALSFTQHCFRWATQAGSGLQWCRGASPPSFSEDVSITIKLIQLNLVNGFRRSHALSR